MLPELITFTDLRDYCEVSTNVADKKYNTYMWQAEMVDLRACIGDQLLQDWIANKTAMKYVKLLNGEIYTPPGASSPIVYHGAKPVIAYYAYARYLKAQNIESTPFGMVTKQNEYSTPITDKTIARKITEAVELAKAFEKDMIKYLNAKADDFPLWKAKCGGCGTKSALTITAVGGSVYR